MKEGKNWSDISVSLENAANIRRVNDIYLAVQARGQESHYLCADVIDTYDKPVQRPTFGEKLDTSWIFKQK